MIYSDAIEAAPLIAQRIAEARRILVLSHINPDGDAIGSLLGVWHALRSMDKEAVPLASSEPPSYTLWLPGIEHLHVYQLGTQLPEADLIIMVDVASLQRVGPMFAEHADLLAKLPLIVIDHHVTNDGPGMLNLITPTAASTCELLYHLFRAMNITIHPAMATCLLLGLTTDTQSFQTSSTQANSLHIAADLLELGAEHGRVVEEVYYSLPASSAELIGAGLSAMQMDDSIAWTTVTQAMIRATGAEDEATDEVVRMMQRIAGVRALVLFKERSDGTTKISLRSKPPINVALLAQRWGGGGHAQASGATLLMPPSAAVIEVLPPLRDLVKG